VAEFSLDAFVRALDRASEDIKREVGALIPAAADAMVARLESRYPIGRHHRAGVPHLRDDVRIRTRQGTGRTPPGASGEGAAARAHLAGRHERAVRRDPEERQARADAGGGSALLRTDGRPDARDMLARAQDILDRPREID
jgi:hypothetical protein